MNKYSNAFVVDCLASEDEHGGASVVRVCAHEGDPVVVHETLTHFIIL